MAPAVVQRNVVSDAALATTVAAAYGGNTTSGNALIAICTSQGSLATITAISDTQGKTWVPLTTVAGNSAIKSWIAYNCSAAADTITVTKGFNDSSLFIFEVSGLGTGNADDATNTKFANQSSVTALSSGNTGTLTYTNNLIIGITVNQNNTSLLPTVGAGYANLQTTACQFNHSGSEEKIVAATTATAATFGIAANSTSHTTAVFVFPDTDVVLLPTVTTQAASSVAKTTATANGNVTATGFATNDHQGIVYDTVTRALPGNVAPGSSGYASSIDAAGSFSTGAFTKSMTGLTKNTTYFYRAYTHNSAGYSYGSEVSFALLASTPLYDAFTDINTGFVDNITSKGDDKLLLEDGTSKLLLEDGTSKLVINYDYPSGNYLTYTTPTLTASTTYYWRVRQKFSGGAYGPWSEIRSFTPTSGANASIAQVAATLTLTGGTQVVQTNSAIAQVAANLTATGGTQAVASVRLVNIAQVAANLTLAGGTQAVASVQMVSITQVAATLTATGGTQTATTNSLNTQVAANLTMTGGTQTVATVNIVNIAQVAANLTMTGGTQAIATVNNKAIAQVAANLTLTGGTQALAVVNNVAISQVAANLTLSGGTQSIGAQIDISIAQVAATLTVAGGTQTIATTSFGSVTQVAANLTVTGGTQIVRTNAIIAQVAANLTMTGGTQTIATVNIVAISQTAATLTLTGGTQAIATTRIVGIAQLAVPLTLTGGTQDVSSQIDASISQVAANLTVSGGTQALSATTGFLNATVAQVAASVRLTGGTHVISTSTGPVATKKYYIDSDGNIYWVISQSLGLLERV